MSWQKDYFVLFYKSAVGLLLSAIPTLIVFAFVLILYSPFEDGVSKETISAFDREYAVALFASWMFGLFLLLCAAVKQTNKARIELQRTKQDITDLGLVRQLDKDFLPYRVLLQRHHNLNHLRPIFTYALKKSMNNKPENGIVIEQAGSAEYLRHLQLALEHGKTSFEAVLLVKDFPPWWFLHDDKAAPGMKRTQKQDYLKAVKNAKFVNNAKLKKNHKLRLLLISWGDPVWDLRPDTPEEGAFEDMANKNLNDFEKYLKIAGAFDKNPNLVKHYLLDKADAKPPELKLAISEAEALGDYAIVDNSLVIKYSSQSLKVIPVPENLGEKYMRIFKAFKETEKEHWILLDQSYFEKCVKAKKLLSREDLSKWK